MEIHTRKNVSDTNNVKEKKKNSHDISIFSIQLVRVEWRKFLRTKGRKYRAGIGTSLLMNEVRCHLVTFVRYFLE